MKNRTNSVTGGKVLSKRKKGNLKKSPRRRKKTATALAAADTLFGSKPSINDDQSPLEIVLKRNELLRLASQVARLGYFELNRKTHQMKWSSQLLAIFETKEGCEPLIGGASCSYIFDEDYGYVLQAFKDAMDGVYNPISYRIRTTSGKIKWLQTTFSGVHENLDKDLVFGTTQDISEIKQLVSNAIAETEIKERNRIAADLHDGVCQHLATIHLAIDTAQKMIREQNPEAETMITEIKDLAVETLAMARKVSHDLMPVDLFNSGFLKGIKAVISRLNRVDKIRYTLNVWGKEKKMPPNVSNNLYRIVQEFIHNSEKHSGATEVTIYIKYQPQLVELTISDNGKGFDPDKVKVSSGIGLQSMINRIKTFSSSFEYKAKEGKGVSLYIGIPI